MPREELLHRIIAEGDRRRRRRHAGIVGGIAAAVVLIGVVAAWPGEDRDQRVTVADTDETTTTTAADETTTTGDGSTSTTVIPDGTATTAVFDPGPTTSTSERPETPDVTATTPVTEPELECRNSNDERCGPFYWDLPPGFVNQPVTISADNAPFRATVGQEVTLQFSANDPDAGACVDTIDLGGGRYVGDAHMCAFAACGVAPRYGPWDPPAIADPASPGFVTWPDARAVYDAPGTYTITVRAFSRTFCGGADLYHSEATSTFTIEVAPA